MPSVVPTAEPGASYAAVTRSFFVTVRSACGVRSMCSTRRWTAFPTSLASGVEKFLVFADDIALIVVPRGARPATVGRGGVPQVHGERQQTFAAAAVEQRLVGAALPRTTDRLTSKRLESSTRRSRCPRPRPP